MSRPASPPIGALGTASPRIGSQINLAQYAADAKLGKAAEEQREGLLREALNGKEATKQPPAGNPSEWGNAAGARWGEGGRGQQGNGEVGQDPSGLRGR